MTSGPVTAAPFPDHLEASVRSTRRAVDAGVEAGVRPMALAASDLGGPPRDLVHDRDGGPSSSFNLQAAGEVPGSWCRWP